MNIFEFAGYDVEIIKQKYAYTRNDCLQLVAASTERNRELDIFPGEPISTATVNVDVKLQKGFILIKNYSENEGVLEALIKEGIVKDTTKTYPVGYCHANLVELLI